MSAETGPVDELAGAHVELREMQRAFDQVADEPAARQRRVLVAAYVAQGAERPVDVGEHDALAADRDPFHPARRQLADFGYGNKSVRHGGTILSPPFAGGERVGMGEPSG